MTAQSYAPRPALALTVAMPDHEQPLPGMGPEPIIQPEALVDDPAYQPLPPQLESAAQVLARLEAANRDQPAPKGPPGFDRDKQLTLRQLLLVTLLLAGCLGVLRWVDPAIGAGLLGYVILAGVIWESLIKLPLPLVVQVTSLGLAAIYVTLGIAAFSRMHMQ